MGVTPAHALVHGWGEWEAFLHHINHRMQSPKDSVSSAAGRGGSCFGFGGVGRLRALATKPGQLRSPEPPPQAAANTGAPHRSTAMTGLRFYAALLVSGVSIMDRPVPPMGHRVPRLFLGPFAAQGQRAQDTTVRSSPGPPLLPSGL